MMENNKNNIKELNEELCVALSNYKFDKAEDLIRLGADVNGFDHDPLMTLANNDDIHNVEGYEKCVNILINNGLVVDPLQESLVRASFNGNHQLIDMLFESGVVTELKTAAPVYEAARNNDLDVLKVLHKHGQLDNPSFINHAFCCANEESHVEVLDFLVNKIDKETMKHEALERAAYFNETKGTEHLLKNHGFSINTHDNSFVLTAIVFSDVSFVKEIILQAEKPYALLTDENVINALIKRDPVLMETLQQSMESFNKQSFDKSNEKFNNLDPALALSKSNNNTL